MAVSIDNERLILFTSLANSCIASIIVVSLCDMDFERGEIIPRAFRMPSVEAEPSTCQNNISVVRRQTLKQ